MPAKFEGTLNAIYDFVQPHELNTDVAMACTRAPHSTRALQNTSLNKYIHTQSCCVYAV